MRLNSNELHNVAVNVPFSDTWRCRVPAPIGEHLSDPKFFVNCRGKLQAGDFVEVLGWKDNAPVEYERFIVLEREVNGDTKLRSIGYHNLEDVAHTPVQVTPADNSIPEYTISKGESIPDVKKERGGTYKLIQDGTVIANGIEDEQEATLMALGQRRIGARYRVI